MRSETEVESRSRLAVAKTLILIHLKVFLFFFKLLFIFDCVGSLLRCMGFSLQWLLLLRSTGSRRAGLSICSMRAQ